MAKFDNGTRVEIVNTQNYYLGLEQRTGIVIETHSEGYSSPLVEVWIYNYSDDAYDTLHFDEESLEKIADDA